MVSSLIVTVILIVAGCFLFMKLFDYFDSEVVKTFLVAGYSLFVVFMLMYWFFDNLQEIMS